jgi:hypothetical protein
MAQFFQAGHQCLPGGGVVVDHQNYAHRSMSCYFQGLVHKLSIQAMGFWVITRTTSATPGVLGQRQPPPCPSRLEGMPQAGEHVEIAPDRHMGEHRAQALQVAKGVPPSLDEQRRAGQRQQGLVPELVGLSRGVQGVAQEDQAAGPHVLGHDLGRQAGAHGFPPQKQRQALEFLHFGHVFHHQAKGPFQDRVRVGPGLAQPRHREN